MKVRETIRQIKERARPLENPYFRALRDGSMGRDDFVETQVQFLFAVVFFSRPMAVLAARLPRPELRWELLENVHDEHGRGDMALSHERTFIQFLERLGEDRASIDRRALWPEVRAFNTLLAGLCLMDDVLTGLACLGVIEDLFSGISAEIGSAVVARGWLPGADLVHYRTHETLDEAHAEAFYRLLEAPYASGARGRYEVEQGLELGASVFLRLYEDLSRHRTRRWLREVGGPHSHASGGTLGTVATPIPPPPPARAG